MKHSSANDFCNDFRGGVQYAITIHHSRPQWTTYTTAHLQTASAVSSTVGSTRVVVGAWELLVRQVYMLKLSMDAMPSLCGVHVHYQL